MECGENIGKKIGNYQIAAVVGRGKFACVYKGRHVILRRRSEDAIKLLNTSLRSKEEQDMFIREAQILEGLKHPHILPIIDAGMHEGIPFIVLEYAPNGSLKDRIQKTLTLEKAIIIVEQIGKALHHAHKKGIIHGDLKPENILFNLKDDALLADFGIAIRQVNTNFGQVKLISYRLYMAPEEYVKNEVSRESDQYALGVIAYELFTGHVPFDSMDMIPTQEPKPLTIYKPDIPPNIEQAVLKAIAKRSVDRHADVRVFITMLRQPPSKTSNKLPINQKQKNQELDNILQERYDVFICYSDEGIERKERSEHSVWVEDLAKNLLNAGLKVWFDRWDLIPGEHWQTGREKGMNLAKCCAICIGDQKPGDWFNQEIQKALIRNNKEDPSFRIIPVISPYGSIDNVPRDLNVYMKVDFSAHIPDYALYLLVCGVKGVEPGVWQGQEPGKIEKKLQQLNEWEKRGIVKPNVSEDTQRKLMDKFLEEP